MSLSRPVKFPLLKLPFLCIECVVKSWNAFDIIFFALTSKRTRQIVKHLKIPLNEIQIFLSELKYIRLDSSFKDWFFRDESEKESSFEYYFRYTDLKNYSLVLQKNAIPLYTNRTNKDITSYTDGNELAALKMAMEFLNEVFNCSVERVWISGGNFPESGDIGLKSTVNLKIYFGCARSQKLNLLFENLKVTGTCYFQVFSTEKDFYVNPKLFKCKKLIIHSDSAAWVTSEILLQFEVPRLNFCDCPFSAEDIVSFVTHWFHSDNKKLEYLYIEFRIGQFSLENFLTEELNPVPFDGRNRVPS
ncbi:hypothetical protein CAEBREN_16038 [Caenorhabditis brenneri]|uniref:Sdz-33 F-box domain-containing protein n=1 Tax=Caenorhabditis brenneri TaxID=135651 RepID=G0N426_CAEBE|nr:hypothetical protein CAEBREN_16038 [Caenorhabditis brenneri]